MFGGAEVFQHVGGKVEGLTRLSGAIAKVETVDEVEGLVLGVLYIEHFGTVFQFGLGQVFAEVHKNGLDGFHLAGFDFFQESTLLVATHFDGGDGGLGHFQDGFGFAFQFVDDDVVVVLEQTVGKVYNFLFGNLGEFVHLVADIAPGAVFDKGIGHLAGAAVVAFGAFHDGQFHVVDGCFEHPVVEFALFHQCNLLVEEGLHLLQGLSLDGLAAEHESTVVVEGIGACIGAHAALLLVDIKVDETALAVVEHALQQVGQHGVVAAVAAVEAVGAHGVLCVKARDSLGDDAGDGLFALEL